MAEGVENGRDRMPTEKGLQYKADVTVKTWRDAIRLWRRRANKHRQLIVEDDVNTVMIKESRNQVQEAMDKAISSQEVLAAIAPSADLDDGEDLLETMEDEHSSLMRETMKVILRLQGGTLSSKSGSRSSRGRIQDWVDRQMSVPPRVQSIVNGGNSAPSMEPIIETNNPAPPSESPATKIGHRQEPKSSNDDVLANSLKELLSLNRLPLPEPGIFSGNPLDYTAWRRSYDALIEYRGIPMAERFYFLLKYLTGEPKSLVEGYSMIGDGRCYLNAKEALEQRYGDPFVVSNAYRDKLDAWPKVGSRDSFGLRRFGDFLKQCDAASKYVPHLNHLDDEQENRNLLRKLPEWLVVKWGRKVVKWRQDWKTFPPFAIFTEFIDEEATVACDPVTSLQSLQTSKERKWSTPSRSLQTGTHNHQDGSAEKKYLSCVFCKGHHHIAECSSFNSETMQKKRQTIKDNGLCFGCLRKGHMSKSCKKRDTCSVCKGKHPTALHDDEWKERRLDATNRERSSNETLESNSHASQSDSSNSMKSSMIVPVWLSHESSHKERLVYALLDTQSDTSFILTQTKEAMGIRGIDMHLLLSTMTKANERIACEKVTGLKAKAYYNSEKVISLPPSYTRDFIPADRHHIPTPDTARSFKHLSRIADMIAPLQDVEIGLLIGYDCAKALAPRAVIHSPDERGPYAVQTDLGWSIVGTVNAGHVDSHNDPICVSHRTTVQIVPEEVQLKGHRSEVILMHQATMKEEITPLQASQLLEADLIPDKNQEPYLQNDLKLVGLMEREIPEETEEEATVIPKDHEVKSNTHASVKEVDELELGRFDHLSSWYRAKRAVAYCLRLKSYLQRCCHARRDGKDVKKVVMEPLTTVLLHAEMEIIRLIQRRTFDEVKSSGVSKSHNQRERRRHYKETSRLYPLDPFIDDDDGILRVGGRLRRSDLSFESKHPVILPQTHLTISIVFQCHNEFWCQWKKEFLCQLQSRQKWTKPHRNMRIGDVVIIKDDNTPRNVWPLGRIVELYQSKDDYIHKVRVMVGDRKLDNVGKRSNPVTYLDRPIHKLVLLLPSEDQE
ncbi:uncharacterized protein LOC129270845 [Lytechinus pictus]|uniref:uncharacterized protein LOC129270845 n=1 Tax=Lytechinus pictus TaxID=7653 RepID=UPI0030BA0D93